MAKNIPNAAEVADRWKTGFGGAGQRWAAGIDAVTTAPGIAAAAAQDRYVQGVNASAPKWASRVAAVPLQTWKDTAKSKGQGRLASGAQAGLAKYQTAIARVLDAEKSIVAGLPPRGTVEQNIQRSAAFQMAMHQAFQQ
jgi:hypothetical protein